MLTQQQQQLLEFIQQRLDADGVCPSFDEMREALALKSKSGIHRLIGGLEERGFIRRLPNRARALEVKRLPSPHYVPQKAPMVKTVTKISGKTAELPITKSQAAHAVAHSATHNAVNDSVMNIPLCGRIAAGLPIEALNNPRGEVMVPAAMLGRGEFYALEVDGDSMIEEGIFDGDTVIIRHAQNAEPGQIVVALVDNETATLKRYQRSGRNVVLEPANASHSPQTYEAKRVQIQGRLAGLLRRY